ncbi:hypothetical protein [Agromyces bauzanensis]
MRPDFDAETVRGLVDELARRLANRWYAESVITEAYRSKKRRRNE